MLKFRCSWSYFQLRHTSMSNLSLLIQLNLNRNFKVHCVKSSKILKLINKNHYILPINLSSTLVTSLFLIILHFNCLHSWSNSCIKAHCVPPSLFLFFKYQLIMKIIWRCVFILRSYSYYICVEKEEPNQKGKMILNDLL